MASTDGNPMLMMVPTTGFIVRMYYGELPNKNAAIAAVCLWAAVTVLVLATTVKTRAWFMMAAVLTGAMEVVGYATRLQMLEKPEYNTYVVSYAFLVIAPVFLAIVEYVCLSKLIHRAQGANGSLFGKAVSAFMIVSEIACLGIQCASAGPLSSHDDATRELGRKMMLTGLVAQIGFFTVFTLISLHVHLSAKFGYNGNKQFTHVFVTLYVTILMIYIRNIFRIAEFGQGFRGYLATHEEFFYGFDFTIIFAILLVFGVFNYGFAFQAAEKAAAASDTPAAGKADAVPRVGSIEVVAVSVSGSNGSVSEV